MANKSYICKQEAVELLRTHGGVNATYFANLIYMMPDANVVPMTESEIIHTARSLCNTCAHRKVCVDAHTTESYRVFHCDNYFCPVGEFDELRVAKGGGMSG